MEKVITNEFQIEILKKCQEQCSQVFRDVLIDNFFSMKGENLEKLTSLADDIYDFWDNSMIPLLSELDKSA